MSFKMSREEALENGFTHFGTMYGAFVWLTDEEAPMVATKYAFMEYYLSFMDMLLNFSNMVFNTQFLFPIMYIGEIPKD